MSTPSRPIHPGEVLRDLLTEAGITPDSALRLARYFGTSARLWVNLQAKHDLDVAEDAMGSRIQREILPRRAA